MIIKGRSTWVPSHMRSIRAILAIESMEFGTCDFTIAWGHKSQVWHGSLHGNTLWRWDLGLSWRVGLSKKLDPTLNTSPAYILAWTNQDLTLMITNLILMVSWGSKVGTWYPILLKLFMVWYNLYLSENYIYIYIYKEVYCNFWYQLGMHIWEFFV